MQKVHMIKPKLVAPIRNFAISSLVILEFRTVLTEKIHSIGKKHPVKQFRYLKELVVLFL